MFARLLVTMQGRMTWWVLRMGLNWAAKKENYHFHFFIINSFVIKIYNFLSFWCYLGFGLHLAVRRVQGESNNPADFSLPALKSLPFSSFLTFSFLFLSISKTV